MRRGVRLLPAFLLVCLFLLGIPGRRAHAGETGVDLHAGTAGLGAAWAVELADVLDLRLLFSGGGLTYRDTEDDVEYDVDLDLLTAGFLLDWFPGGGGFRFSGGLLYNGNELSGTGRPRDATDIGGTRYSPAEIGTLRATVDFAETAWYVGIGAGRTARGGSRLSLTFDAGLMFYDDPDFTLTANGTLADQPSFQADLARERRDLESDYVDRWTVYPVLAVGLAYRF